MILVDDSKANWACLILSLAAITETLTCFSLTYRMVSNFTNFLVFCYYIFQCFFKIFFCFHCYLLYLANNIKIADHECYQIGTHLWTFVKFITDLIRLATDIIMKILFGIEKCNHISVIKERKKQLKCKNKALIAIKMQNY